MKMSCPFLGLDFAINGQTPANTYMYYPIPFSPLAGRSEMKLSLPSRKDSPELIRVELHVPPADSKAAVVSTKSIKFQSNEMHHSMKYDKFIFILKCTQLCSYGFALSMHL